jgi:hypothetical protein
MGLAWQGTSFRATLPLSYLTVQVSVGSGEVLPKLRMDREPVLWAVSLAQTAFGDCKNFLTSAASAR